MQSLRYGDYENPPRRPRYALLSGMSEVIMSCSLCTVLEEEKYRVVFRDEFVFVALNFEPLKAGHLIVLPIRHIENLSDLSADEARAFNSAIDQSMRALALNSEETPMCFLNGWKRRSQPHFHMHIILSKESMRGLFVAAEGCPYRQRVTSEALVSMADQLRPLFISDSFSISDKKTSG